FITYFFFSSRRRHTRSTRDWSSDVCSSDLRTFLKHSKSDNSILRSEISSYRSMELSDLECLRKVLGLYLSVLEGILFLLAWEQRSEERRVGKECRFWWLWCY